MLIKGLLFKSSTASNNWSIGGSLCATTDEKIVITHLTEKHIPVEPY